MLRYDKRHYYNGNSNIKRAGIVENLTSEQMVEFIKCKNDVVYFLSKYVKVLSLDHGLVPFEPFDYQHEMLLLYSENRFNINMLARQMGKSVIVGGYILHQSLFHSQKKTCILANKAATAREILDKIRKMLETVPLFLQSGVTVYNKGFVEFSNGSSIMAASTSSDSVRGFSFNCVSGDTKVTILDDNNNVFHIDIKDVDNMNKIKHTKKYLVYKIVNVINNKEYIGFHSTYNINDGYMGSGKLIILAIEKYGIDKFHKEILKVFDNKQDAEDYERLLVNLEYTKRSDTYNLSIGGNVCILYGENNGFYEKKHSEEFKKSQSIRLTGTNFKKDDDLVVDGVTYSSFNTYKSQTNQSKLQAIRSIMDDPDGFVHNAYHIKYAKILVESEQKTAAANIKFGQMSTKLWKGKQFSPERLETQKKFAQYDRSPKQIEALESRNKNKSSIRKAAKTHRGMVRSDASKQRMSDAAKGRPANNKGKVYSYCPKTKKRSLTSVVDVPEGNVRGVFKGAKP